MKKSEILHDVQAEMDWIDGAGTYLDGDAFIQPNAKEVLTGYIKGFAKRSDYSELDMKVILNHAHARLESIKSKEVIQ